DQAEDRRAAGGVAEARRDPLLPGRVAGAVDRVVGQRRRGDRRRRDGRGRGLRGDRRGGGRDQVVTDEQQVTEETVEEQTPEVDPLAEVTRERDQYLDALQRLKAEFDNYRKRTAREQSDLSTRAALRLVGELLPVLDDLERALAAAEEHEEAKLEEG